MPHAAAHARAGLGSDPETLKYFVQAELVHARFAMLGAAGIVLTGLATKAGALNVPEWYDAGLVAIKGSGIPLGALIIVQARPTPHHCHASPSCRQEGSQQPWRGACRCC